MACLKASTVRSWTVCCGSVFQSHAQLLLVTNSNFYPVFTVSKINAHWVTW